MHRPTACFVLLTILCMNQVINIAGHGWMVSPTPRSGGGTGTANASTASPCGKTGPTTIQGTFAAGSTIPVSFMRANGHGTNGPVTFTISYAAATGTPTAAQFTSGQQIGAFTMNTATADVQTKSVTLPSTVGTAVIQFKWVAGDGSQWFDCAYIEVIASGPCATNNGGCSTNAACTGNGICTCKAGFFGDGRTCTAVPPPVSVVLTLGAPTGANFQDPFTQNIATALSIPAVRINYDSVAGATTNSPVVSFSITADPVSGESGAGAANTLRTMVATGNPRLAATIGFPVAGVAVAGATTPVTFGSAPDDSVNTKAIGLGLGITGAFVIAVLMGLLVWHKRRSGGASHNHQKVPASPVSYVSNPSPVPVSMSYPVASPAAASAPIAPSKPITPAPAFVPEQVVDVNVASAPEGEAANSTMPLQGQSVWIVSTDDAGNTYYYNTHTGVSQWEIPPEFK